VKGASQRAADLCLFRVRGFGLRFGLRGFAEGIAMVFVSSAFVVRRRVTWISTLFAAALVLAACSSTTNNNAQCGPGTRIKGTTCVAVSASSTSGSTSGGDVPDGGGSSSSGSSSGASGDAGKDGPQGRRILIGLKSGPQHLIEEVVAASGTLCFCGEC
jgi:hypothetical protein